MEKKSEPMLYGYSIDNLVMFAQACRREGITEDQLQDFVNNVNHHCDYVMHEFRDALEKEIQTLMENRL